MPRHPIVPKQSSNLTSDHDHSRPADILLPNWALGKPAAFDISVTSPLNPKVLSVAGLSAGAAALSTEERKHMENDPKCNALGRLYIRRQVYYPDTEYRFKYERIPKSG